MPRRAPYTKVKKTNRIQVDHVEGMGDVVFRGFDCLNADCKEFMFIRETELGEPFEVECSGCGTVMRSGEDFKYYDYDLEVRGETIESGSFTILVDDYINEAAGYKYCIICSTLKPLEAFGRHSARTSGRQGECRLCKTVYNSIKNQTRTTDQHREASQRRRLYLDLSKSPRIESEVIYERFGYKCFNCVKDLDQVESESERPLDHTLPAWLLWPLTTDNATLLCRDCNGEKSGKWPGEFYDDPQLRRLAGMTGIAMAVLSGEPHFNPEALERLKDPDFVNAIVGKYASRFDDLINLRNRVLAKTSLDFFRTTDTISPTWTSKADELRDAAS